MNLVLLLLLPMRRFVLSWKPKKNYIMRNLLIEKEVVMTNLTFVMKNWSFVVALLPDDGDSQLSC